MYTPQQTANLIKQLAKERDVTVSKMLIDCTINKDALYTMQSKNFFPRIETITKIADYLGVSIDYLLGRSASPEIYDPILEAVHETQITLDSDCKTKPIQNNQHHI